MCCCGCWPITWSGICAGRWRRCYSMRKINEAAETQRSSIVAPAQRSLSAQQKALNKQTVDGFPVHSFRSLLADLATLTRNRVRMGEQLFDMLATPTALQERAFELLQVRP